MIKTKANSTVLADLDLVVKTYSKSRLTALEHAHRAAHAAANGFSEAIAEARNEVEKHRRIVADNERMVEQGVKVPARDVRAAIEGLAEETAKLEMLLRRREPLHAAANHLGRIVNSCRAFVAQNQLQPRTKPVLTSLDDRVVLQPAALATEIEKLREKIVAAKSEIHDVRTAPRPLDEMLAVLDEKLDRHVGLRNEGLGPLTNALFSDVDIKPMVIAYLFKDELRARMHAEVETYYSAIVPGLATNLRAQKIASLESEIFELEVQEERNIRSLEAAGQEPERREDARPDLILDNFDNEKLWAALAPEVAV